MAKILLTDDSDTIREFLKDMLKDGGHTVIGEARNGQEGVDLFQELKPEITILDIAMPVMDGMTALEKIMEIDPHARILMVSSAKQDGNIPRSMIMGACEFIEKPFEKEQLLAVLAKIEKGLPKPAQ